jgi:hypothetical protein
MYKYNRDLRNLNKKFSRGSKFNIHTQVIRRGQGVSRDGASSSPFEELTRKT